MSETVQTWPGLLARLGQGGGERDWRIFYERYSGAILNFCRQRGVHESGAEDVLQETMIVLIRKLPAFRYDPAKGRFRNWLLGVVHNKIREDQRRKTRLQTIPLDEWKVGTKKPDAIDANVPGEDYPGMEEEWHLALMAQAWQILGKKRGLKSTTLAVFEACALRNEPVPEVAERFKLKPNAVYQIKDRLTRRLKKIVRFLDEPGLRPWIGES